jgi:hypothetical protein
MTPREDITVRRPLRVRVKDEFVLDAGTCEDLATPHGPERLLRPPATTFFHQVLAYLRAKPDPPERPRMVKELDLFESNHGCGLNAVFLVKHPKWT